MMRRWAVDLMEETGFGVVIVHLRVGRLVLFSFSIEQDRVGC
jgi:hypothetical protein